MFKDCLNELKRTLLNKTKGDKVMYDCVQLRLQKSRNVYYEKLEKTCSVIESKNTIRVIKALAKQGDKNEK